MAINIFGDDEIKRMNRARMTSPKQSLYVAEPTYLQSLGQRGGEVARYLWNAPNVTQGLGRVANVISSGYGNIADTAQAGIQDIGSNIKKTGVELLKGAGQEIGEPAPLKPVVEQIDKERYIPKGTDAAISQISTSEGPYDKITANGLTTISGPSGEAYFERGAAQPGTFSIQAGPRGGLSEADWNKLSQPERTAIRVAEIKKQSAQAQPDQIGQSSNSGVTVIGDPSLQESMDDYLSGRVGSPGYTKISNLIALNRKLTGNTSGLSSRELGARADLLKASPIGDLLSRAGTGSSKSGPSLGDVIDLQKLGLDRQKYALQAQTEAAKLMQGEKANQLKQEEFNLTRGVEQARAAREEAEARRAAQDFAETSTQTALQNYNLPTSVQGLINGSVLEGIPAGTAAGIVRNALSATPDLAELASRSDLDSEEQARLQDGLAKIAQRIQEYVNRGQ